MIKTHFIALGLLLMLLSAPVVAFASDISGAKYFGVISVSNNSTATNNVAVTANISTTNLINGNYLNATVTNAVMRNSSGAEVRFMPGYTPDGNPWAMWAPSIGNTSLLNYILYTADSSGGELRYFPGATGMAVSDSASLEPSDNFTYSISGYIDTSAVGANITSKGSAFNIAIGSSGNITAEFGASGNQTPTVGELSHSGLISWTPAVLLDWEFAAAGFHTDTSGSGSYMQIDYGSGSATPLTSWQYFVGGANCNAVWDIEYSDNASTWTKAYIGLDVDGAGGWHTANWTSVGSHRYWRSLKTDGAAPGDVHTELHVESSTPALSVSALGISAGDYKLDIYADTANLTIEIDDVVQDTISLAGASISDNGDNWIIAESDAMPYMETANLTIDGALQGSWEWEYGLTFTDLSGNSHDATPTFRTASSDADVSASMTSFRPIAEAQAPGFALEEAPAFIDDDALTGNITSSFTTAPGTGTGTFPLADIITTVANATGTPPQLPLLLIAVFVILAASLSVSAVLRRQGSGSLIIKIGVIVALMGIFLALGNFAFDFWMIFIFLVISIAVAFASRQLGWT